MEKIMLKVAITGNIAAGKSLVESILQEKGFEVLDTDKVTHDLLMRNGVKKHIIAVFFGFDILENNEISRPKLGKLVFENKLMRTKLEEILHPLIKNEITRFFQKAESSDKKPKALFVSVPLLFEVNFQDIFDKTVLIYANDKTRLQRLMNRNGLSLKDAENRLNSQISQDEKVSLADYVIYNDKSIEDLSDNVETFLEKL